ncbi:MAG: hypothetical protein VZS44_09160 [Bacilli bacterium]|nr:hypothetical protein [Bacilli bacterium]
MKRFGFQKGNFRFASNRVVFNLEDFWIDNEQHNCDAENIVKGPFIISFDKPIIINKGQIKDIEDISYKNYELTICGTVYKYEETDFVYFLGDFGADDTMSLEIALQNIMNNFCAWVLKNYS